MIFIIDQIKCKESYTCKNTKQFQLDTVKSNKKNIKKKISVDKIDPFF